MTSRGGVVPFSHTQDSVGPMCKSTWDVAVMMNVMRVTDVDTRDKSATGEAISHATEVKDYTKYLTNSFKDIKLALPMKEITMNYTLLQLLGITAMGQVNPEFPEVAMEAIKKMESLGAKVLYDNLTIPRMVELATRFPKANETVVLNYDFRYDIDTYLADLSAPAPKNASPIRNLQDLINFNDAHAAIEMPAEQCCQQGFINSAFALDEGFEAKEYKDALRWSRDIIGREQGLDFVFKQHPELTALVMPSDPLAPKMPAIAGYPIATVPLGVLREGAPFSMSFIGRRFDETSLIKVMSAWEANFPKRTVPKNIK